MSIISKIFDKKILIITSKILGILVGGLFLAGLAWTGYIFYLRSQLPEDTFSEPDSEQIEDPYYNLPLAKKRNIEHPDRFESYNTRTSLMPIYDHDKQSDQQIIKLAKKKEKLAKQFYQDYPDQPEAIAAMIDYYLSTQIAYYRIGKIEKAKRIRAKGKEFVESVPEKFMKYGPIRKPVQNYNDFALAENVFDTTTKSIDELLSENDI